METEVAKVDGRKIGEVCRYAGAFSLMEVGRHSLARCYPRLSSRHGVGIMAHLTDVMGDRRRANCAA